MKFKDIRSKKHKRKYEDYIHGIYDTDVWEHIWNNINTIHAKTYGSEDHLDYKLYDDLLTPKLYDQVVEMYRDKYNEMIIPAVEKIQEKIWREIYDDMRQDKDVDYVLRKIHKRAIKRREQKK